MQQSNITKIDTDHQEDHIDIIRIPKDSEKFKKMLTKNTKIKKKTKSDDKQHSKEIINDTKHVQTTNGSIQNDCSKDSKQTKINEFSKIMKVRSTSKNKDFEKANDTHNDMEGRNSTDTINEAKTNTDYKCTGNNFVSNKSFDDKQSKSNHKEDKRMELFAMDTDSYDLDISNLEKLNKERRNIRNQQFKNFRNDLSESNSESEERKHKKEKEIIFTKSIKDRTNLEDKSKETEKSQPHKKILKNKTKKNEKDLDKDYEESDDSSTTDDSFDMSNENNNNNYVQREIVDSSGEIKVQYKRGRKKSEKKKQILLNDKESSHFQINYKSINNNIPKQLKSDYKTHMTYREVYKENLNIAPAAQNLLKENNKGMKRLQLKWNKIIDEFNKIEPYNPNDGKVLFTDNDVRKYCKRVSSLTYECLTRINDELFNEDCNENTLENLTWKLAAIPSFVKSNDNKIKRINRIQNSYSNKNNKMRNIIQSDQTTLEEGELHPQSSGFAKVNDAIELNKMEILSKIHKNNYYYDMMKELCSKSSFDVSIKEKRMLDALIGKGKIGDAARRAYSINNGSNDSFDNKDILNKLKNCHKFDKEDNLIFNSHTEKEKDSEEEEDDYNSFLNDENELGEIITMLNGHSSAGANGWSISLIKMIINQNKLILKELMNFINGLIAREYFPPFFFVGRLIAIKKNGPNQEGKIRPICVTDAFRKVVSRVLLHLHQKKLMEHVPKEQYGVGTRNGSAIITSIIEHSLDYAKKKKEDMYIVQTDIDNAFPSVSRQMMIDSLLEIGVHKSFVSFVYQSFAKEDLIYFEGESPEHIPCSKGVAQGCVLSPILFSIATRKVQERINAKIKANDNSPPGCLSYLDDMFFISKNKEELQTNLNIAQEELELLGMRINPIKSKSLIIKEGEESEESLFTIQNQLLITVKSLKVLGSLITCNYKERIDYFIEKVKKSLITILSVSKIHLQSFLHIVRNCISTKLSHLVRSMLLPKYLLSDYDDVIIAIITKTLELSNKFNPDLINCPMSKGGLGIAALKDIQSLSITASQQYVCYHSTYLLRTMNEMKNLMNLRNENDETKIFPKALPNYLFEQFKADYGVLNCFITLQSMLTKRQLDIIESKGQHGMWLELSEEKFQNILLDATEELQITLHSTSSVESSAWLRTLPYAPYQKMQDDEFKSSCANRLGDENTLEGIINRMRKAKVFYGRCPKCGSKLSSHHYSCCRFTQSTRSARHHCLKLLVAQYFREIPGVYIKVEDTTALSDEIKESRRVPDIVVSVYDQCPTVTEFEQKYLKSNRKAASFFEFGIDITVPEDHAVKHLTQAKNGKITEKLEKMKNDIYKEYTKTHGMVVVPMVITSNGNYGKSTNEIIKLMKELCKRNKVIFPKSQMIERISMLLESSRFQMREIFYNELQRLTIQGEMRITKKSHITLPKLSDDVNFNFSNSYWKQQIKIATHLVNGKDPIALKLKIKEVEEKAKFSYVPKDNPPPEPPNAASQEEEGNEENVFINTHNTDSDDLINTNNNKHINSNHLESEDGNNKNINYSNDEEIDLNENN